MSPHATVPFWSRSTDNGSKASHATSALVLKICPFLVPGLGRLLTHQHADDPAAEIGLEQDIRDCVHDRNGQPHANVIV
jgi:hypothetical protein